MRSWGFKSVFSFYPQPYFKKIQICFLFLHGEFKTFCENKVYLQINVTILNTMLPFFLSTISCTSEKSIRCNPIYTMQVTPPLRVVQNKNILKLPRNFLNIGNFFLGGEERLIDLPIQKVTGSLEIKTTHYRLWNPE